MPDWGKLVAEKLDATDLPPQQRQEIAAELASHLEEAFEEQRARGATESEAVGQALSEVFDWNELARRIRRAKREEGIMNDRTRRLWLPGLASFLAAVVVEATLAKWSYQPRMLFRSHVTQIMYGLWLVAQLFCGAIGAYLSRRAGGPRSTRLGAALFTPAILLSAILSIVGVSVIARATGLWRQDSGSVHLLVLFRDIAIGVLIPSVAMVIGALPFLSDRRQVAPETIGVA